MPSYVKFLKDILTKKRKLEDFETVALIEECNAIIQNELPPKLKDLGSFSIPCVGVSFMPLTTTRKLQLNKIQPTIVSLQLADKTIRYLVGIIEDILVKVGKLYIPMDFIMLEMEDDIEILFILGRPFLAIVGVIIDVKNGKITFKVGEEEVEFNVFNTTDHASFTNNCYKVDFVNEDKGKLIPTPLMMQAPTLKLEPPPPYLRNK
ncbi:PREDICTED: uncharacterized protein LOC108661551 [Theobroma cacao]|uniref:Uncharacterized protein LOC108661551 n=1 Tax=Theobroma cacao TaxID=3641 RepID=A0AB32W607_THECC|nr:PREDICTED: uncharacterized protein LOC108661551 [Theobroma cacao]